MIIGIDLDGVLRDFTRQFILIYNRLGPADNKLVPIDYEPKYWGEKLDGKGSFTDQKLAKFVWDKHQYELMYRAPVIIEGVEMLNELKTLGHECVFITHQYKSEGRDATYEWVMHHFGKKALKVIYAPGLEKYMHCDILIDDNVENCQKMIEHAKPVFCIARDFNSNFTGSRGNYKEAVAYVKSFLK